MAFSGKGRIKTKIATISPVQFIILSLLNQGPAHGYMILQQLRQRLGGWVLKSGTIYPALHNMEEKNLIDSKRVSQDDRPDAVQYHITSKGKRLLQEAFSGLGSEFRVQDNLWRFLCSSVNGKALSTLLDWTMREQNPIGFIAMKCHCEQDQCEPVHLDFLKRYREYLQKELDWAKRRIAELKSSKEK